MDTNCFEKVARLLTTVPSRREVLHGLIAAGLGLGTLRLVETAEAKKKRKKNKNTPKKNAFGCVDVGKPCRGNSATCCSGICLGKKPKKGKQDKSTCLAHNTGGCTPERSVCVTGNATSLCSPEGVCLTTTGNAGFCADADVGITNCQPCRTDTDCEALGFGAGAACVIFDGPFCDSPDEGCAGHNGSRGTACLQPRA